MDISLAKEILLKEFSIVRNSDKFHELEVNFIGGEPFLNFHLIKEIVEWMCQLNQKIPFITSCSTNGTLIDNTNKNWLYQYRDQFIPVLSYDGNYKMQNQNRQTNQNAIDRQFFMETWPEEFFHMTISKETLPNLAEGVLSLQRAGGKLDAALAQGINWSIEDAIVFREQLAILSHEYLKDTFIKPINLLGRMLFGIGKSLSYQEKYCGTGTSMIAYDIDAKTYPCHMFSPVVLGYERALELALSGIKSNRYFDDPFCDNCNLKHWCPTCYGFNYRFRNDLSVRDHYWCKMVRAQAIASCEFQIAYYDKYIDELSSQDMTQLKAALKAYHQLMDDHREIDSTHTTERG